MRLHDFTAYCPRCSDLLTVVGAERPDHRIDFRPTFPTPRQSIEHVDLGLPTERLIHRPAACGGTLRLLGVPHRLNAPHRYVTTP